MSERTIEHRDGSWWIVEHRAGTEIHLASLAPNERVGWGDGETYHLLLTRTTATTEAEALKLAAAPQTDGNPNPERG